MDNSRPILLQTAYTDPKGVEAFTTALSRFLDGDFAVLCIGSDRTVADALGPLCGSMLSGRMPHPVFGTLDKPVHNENLRLNLDIIRAQYPTCLLLTVDAAMSSGQGLGELVFRDSGLRAADAYSDGIDAGDLSLVGVTARQLYSPAPSMQPIRLQTVMGMAASIAAILARACGCEPATCLNPALFV